MPVASATGIFRVLGCVIVSIWTIVVAAGKGTRYGGAKQYDKLGGRRVLDWSLDTAHAVSDGVVVVIADDQVAEVEDASAVDVVVAGGASRAESVRNGLSAVPADATVILVHDAARPLATSSLFTSVIEAVSDGADAVIPGIPVVDTIKRVDADMTVQETIDRSQLLAVQTPQGFRAEVLRQAHSGGDDATDDAGLVEKVGGRVIAIPGEAHNLKITVLSDLRVVEALLPT